MPSTSTPPKRGRIAILDGLRFVAALMVVGYHYTAIGRGWDQPVQTVFPHVYLPASYGWLGVYLFFLISGFVICLSCWGRSLGDFFTSRVIRLFPAFWFAVICTTLVLTFVHGQYHRLAYTELLSNLTMLQEPLGVRSVDGVYWTLWVEMRFYLLFALVVWKGVTYRRVVTFCCVWAAAAVCASGLDNPVIDLVVMPDTCWYFISGISFFLMWKFRPTPLLWGIVALSFLAAQHSLLVAAGSAERHMEHHIAKWPVVLLLLTFYVLMAGAALGWFSRVNWRWLPVAGSLTYPLYLLHEYIGWNVITQLQYRLPPPVLVVSLIATMLFASWCVQRFVERPVSKRLRAALARSFADIRLFSHEATPNVSRPSSQVTSGVHPDVTAGSVRLETSVHGGPGSLPPGNAR